MRILLALALTSSVSPVSAGPTLYPGPQLLLTVQQGGQTIPPSGGTVTLEGVGSITFPAGAFGVPTGVALDSLTSAVEDAIFDGSSSGAPITGRLTYFLRVLADENPSVDTDVEVAIEVPDQLASRVDGNESLVVWIRVCQCTEFERIDNYLPPSLATTFDSDAGVLRVTVPAAMFTKLRRPDRRAELLLVIATMAIQPPRQSVFHTGTIAFDVTDDVVAFLSGTLENHGWVVKKEEETLSGHVAFASRESATPPQLLLTVQQTGQTIPRSGGTVTLEAELIRPNGRVRMTAFRTRPVDHWSLHFMTIRSIRARTTAGTVRVIANRRR